MNFYKTGLFLLIAGIIISCSPESQQSGEVATASMSVSGEVSSTTQDSMDTDKNEKIVKSEQEWKQILTDKEYRILRKRGTEMPFVNEYWDNKKEGIYYCAACGNPLYSSEHKYRSGTGWPSFWQPLDERAVAERPDSSFFMVRTEIVCARCDSHLGHVFEDGPEPTGLRYCMNSAALDFKSKEELPNDTTGTN